MSVTGTRPVRSKACWLSRPGTRAMTVMPGLKPSLRFHSVGSMWVPAPLAGIELCALVPPVRVGLPGEADAAVQLDVGSRRIDCAIRCPRLRHGRGLRRALRLRVRGPRREEGRRTAALGVEEHLRRLVLDG